MALKYLTVAPSIKHTATVIFMHGLGDTGYGWKPVADVLKSDLPYVKWVLPHSPIRPVTANRGMVMPAWFDISTLDDLYAKEDEDSMLGSVRSLDALIQAEVDAGIPPSRIIVGGFSQGGAMSLLTGLTGTGTREALGGVVVMSGWLPMSKKFRSLVSPHAASVPIFWGHGTNDLVVKYQLGCDSVKYLTSQIGIKHAEPNKGVYAGLDFRSYKDMDHASCPEELDDFKEFIKRCVPPDA